MKGKREMKNFGIALGLIVALFSTSMASAAPGYMEEYYTMQRDNPKYEYVLHVLQLPPSGGFLGIGKSIKYLVQINGMATADSGLDPQKNRRGDTRIVDADDYPMALNRIVDEQHKIVRSLISEQDWAKLDQEKLEAALKAAEAELQQKYQAEIAAQIAAIKAALEAKQKADKPVLKLKSE